MCALVLAARGQYYTHLFTMANGKRAGCSNIKEDLSSLWSSAFDAAADRYAFADLEAQHSSCQQTVCEGTRKGCHHKAPVPHQ